VDSHKSIERTERQVAARSLQIEEDGDRWRGFKPKIRLVGRWLERAGFAPGDRVQITCVAPGVIELRSSDDGGGQHPRGQSSRPF